MRSPICRPLPSWAVTNLFSNIFATVVVAKWMGELDEVKAGAVLDGGSAADERGEVFARGAGE